MSARSRYHGPRTRSRKPKMWAGAVVDLERVPDLINRCGCPVLLTTVSGRRAVLHFHEHSCEVLRGIKAGEVRL